MRITSFSEAQNGLKSVLDGVVNDAAHLSGLWSQRIDESNRLVYTVNDIHITIFSCRYDYFDTFIPAIK